MNKTGSNLGKFSVTRLMDNLVDNITTTIKKRSKNKTIKRNPKLNHNRGVTSAR